MPYGNFDQHAQGVWDFVRCQRSDGSYYGTGGTCRKGDKVSAKQKQALAKLKPEQLKQLEESPKLSSIQKKAVKEEIVKHSGVGGAKEEYAKLMKQQQELVQKGDIDGAMKLQKKISTMVSVLNDLPEVKAQIAETKKLAERKEKEAKTFETAQERRLEGQKAAKLSDVDKKALSDYSEDKQGSRSFFDLNRCLRVPSICRDKTGSAQFVKELDSAIKKLPKNESGEPFYRGLNFRPGALSDQEKLWSSLQDAKPGDVLKDPGFGSYSANRRVAQNFVLKEVGQRNIIFISRNKALTPINNFSNIKDEEEAILPRRTSQTIRSVTKTGDFETGYTLTIELD